MLGSIRVLFVSNLMGVLVSWYHDEYDATPGEIICRLVYRMPDENSTNGILSPY